MLFVNSVVLADMRSATGNAARHSDISDEETQHQFELLRQERFPTAVNVGEDTR